MVEVETVAILSWNYYTIGNLIRRFSVLKKQNQVVFYGLFSPQKHQ